MLVSTYKPYSKMSGELDIRVNMAVIGISQRSNSSKTIIYDLINQRVQFSTKFKSYIKIMILLIINS